MAEHTADDYPEDLVQASRSILVELWTILGSYRDALVLFGGWAPYLLLETYQSERSEFEHTGSIDVDVAVDPERVDDDAYATIVERLRDRGYTPREGRLGDEIPSSLERTIAHRSGELTTHVDFATPPHPDRQGRRHREVQPGLPARQSDGCEALFTHHFETDVTADLPGGGRATVRPKVADVVGIWTTKGLALGDRYKEKDAYDLYAVTTNYREGPDSVAEELAPHAHQGPTQQALGHVREAFSSPEAHGPTWVADFVDPSTERERQRVRTDAFMVVDRVLDRVL